MAINWQTTENNQGGISLHACSDLTDEKALQGFTDSCIKKAVELLTENLSDSARYFVFNWSLMNQTLSISIADDDKQTISQQQIHIEMSRFNEHFCEEDLLFWIKDYLGVCTGFLNYSLLAVYSADNKPFQLI